MNAILRTTWLLVAICLFSIASAQAVQPDEALSDPALESRARTLSEELRCMVCQNQSIDNSDADLAHDLRLLVRDRLTAGDSDAEVLDYIVSRYGEFVLLKPRFSLRNAVLWGTPVMILALGGFVLLRNTRTRKSSETAALDPQEAAALDEILRR